MRRDDVGRAVPLFGTAARNGYERRPVDERSTLGESGERAIESPLPASRPAIEAPVVARDDRSAALEDAIWIARATSIARARSLEAGAIAVSEGRLVAEAAGPLRGNGAPDLVVVRRLVGLGPRRLTLYASLPWIDAERALRYREVSFARVVLALDAPLADGLRELLSQRGVAVRALLRGELP